MLLFQIEISEVWNEYISLGYWTSNVYSLPSLSAPRRPLWPIYDSINQIPSRLFVHLQSHPFDLTTDLGNWLTNAIYWMAPKALDYSIVAPTARFMRW